jgi:hypothetical protein
MSTQSQREYQRAYREAHRDEIAARQRAYLRGEIPLPELDWAICVRGGSEAQAMAHRRRGEKPCPACRRAEIEAGSRRRKARTT